MPLSVEAFFGIGLIAMLCCAPADRTLPTIIIGHRQKNSQTAGGTKMRISLVKLTGALMCLSVAIVFVACAKDDVAPIDVEKQAFEDLRGNIREVITDPVREAETTRLVGVLEEDLAVLRASISLRKNRVRELNANYDTPRAEFEAFLAGVEAEVRDNRRRVSATHRALFADLTSEERSAIAKSHTKAMQKAIKTLQSI